MSSPKDKEAQKQERSLLHRKMYAYDAETFQKYHNTTSWFKRCIDGYFFNHSDLALKELQSIITVADRGMNILQTEIERAREEQRDLHPGISSSRNLGGGAGASAAS